MAAPVLPARSLSWPVALSAVMADLLQPPLIFQPVVDLARGVVAGYEVLSRFDGPVQASPDRWFAAALAAGCGAALEARVVRRALVGRAQLRAGRFLTVNVSPQQAARQRRKIDGAAHVARTPPPGQRDRPCLARQPSAGGPLSGPEADL